jgi:hypothetical protein
MGPGFWKALLALALIFGATIASLRAIHDRRPPAIGWAVVGEGDFEDAKVVLRAGEIVRVAEPLTGRVLLGAVDVRLSPGAEIRVPSATAVDLRAGVVHVTSRDGSARFVIRAGAYPPVVLPALVARGTLSLSEKDGGSLRLDVEDGLFEWGEIRVGAGERAIALCGGRPEKRPDLPDGPP